MIVTQDLHISKRLKALLPPLTKEERTQLEANIVADGRVTDTILYWHDGKENKVADGMHRFEIARRLGIPYKTEPIEIGDTYEDVELWILNRQLGRRNLLSPQAIRKVRGELYNKLKRKDGGHGDQRSGGQIVPPKPAAETVADVAGVDPKTIKRDGARVEALKKCSPAVQKGVNSEAFKASDADIQTLSKLNEVNQDNIANDLRKGKARTVKEAMEKRKIKQPGGKKPAKKKPTPAKKGNYGKCPACAGVKWTEDKDGHVVCAKCRHPHGEPAGDADEDRLTTQRLKTVKTAEALMRAFDDLHTMKAKSEHDEVIKSCKKLIKTAKGWK